MTVKLMFAGVAAVAALSFATPSSAAPVEQLDCIEQKAGTAALDSLGDEIIKAWIAEKQGDYSHSLVDTQLLADAMESCAKQYGWTEYESANAGYATIAEVYSNKLAGELSRRGVDVVALTIFFTPYSPIEPDLDNAQYIEIISGISNVQGINVDDDLLVSLAFLHWAMGYMAKTAKQGFIDGTEPLMRM